MQLIKISLILILGLIGLNVQAQVPAPLSVALSLEMPAPAEGDMVEDILDENGEPHLSDEDHQVVVLVELAVDQELQKLHLQIDGETGQPNILSHSFDLIAVDQSPEGFQIQRNGKVIEIDLGVFPLPATYNCEVKVEDINGEVSPAKVYSSSL